MKDGEGFAKVAKALEAMEHRAFMRLVKQAEENEFVGEDGKRYMRLQPPARYIFQNEGVGLA